MPDLIDIVLEGFKQVVGWVIDLFMRGLREGYRTLVAELFGTPTPTTDGALFFGEPSREPWTTIRDGLVGGEIMLTALLLLVICIQARHTLRIFNVGGAAAARKAKKTAWIGVFLIVTWYWLAVLTLYLVDGFTIALVPTLDAVSSAMLRFLEVSIVNPGLALLFAMVGGVAMWVVRALFFVREVLLYVYLYGMPIAFAVAFGNVPVLSGIAMGFAKRFVPLAVLPLPAAVLLQGYDLLFGGGVVSLGTAFLQYVVAVSLPVVVLVVTWQTFRYATPLTARVLGGAAKGVTVVGAVGAGAAVAGPSVATTGARWGSTAAASQLVAERVASRGDDSESASEDGSASYRRTENDPVDTQRDARQTGMAFDRGIH